MSRRVTALPRSKSDPHGGKGNALHRPKPRAASQANPDLNSNTNLQAMNQAYAQQSDGVEQMAQRVRKFQGPWSAVHQPTDDNIEGGY